MMPFHIRQPSSGDAAAAWIQLHRNLVRLAREGKLNATQLQQALDRAEADVEQFELREVNLTFARDRTMPVLSTPRSLDLVHLRTALRFHSEQPLTRFLSLDATLNRAAREMGLPVDRGEFGEKA
jgi:hypothetical protein